MANSAAIMLNTTTEFLSQSGSGTKASVNALGVAGNGIDSLNSALTGTTDSINQALSQSASFYSAVSTCVGNALDSYNSDAQACANALTAVSGRVQNLIDGYQSLENALIGIRDSGTVTNQGVLDLLNKAIYDINSAKNSQIAIRDSINDAASGYLHDHQHNCDCFTDISKGNSQSVNNVYIYKTAKASCQYK